MHHQFNSVQHLYTFLNTTSMFPFILSIWKLCDSILKLYVFVLTEMSIRTANDWTDERWLKKALTEKVQSKRSCMIDTLDSASFHFCQMKSQGAFGGIHLLTVNATFSLIKMVEPFVILFISLSLTLSLVPLNWFLKCRQECSSIWYRKPSFKCCLAFQRYGEPHK